MNVKGIVNNSTVTQVSVKSLSGTCKGIVQRHFTKALLITPLQRCFEKASLMNFEKAGLIAIL